MLYFVSNRASALIYGFIAFILNFCLEDVVDFFNKYLRVNREAFSISRLDFIINDAR